MLVLLVLLVTIAGLVLVEMAEMAEVGVATLRVHTRGVDHGSKAQQTEDTVLCKRLGLRRELRRGKRLVLHAPGRFGRVGLRWVWRGS